MKLMDFIEQAHMEGSLPSQMRLLTSAVVLTIMGMWVAHNVTAMIHGAGFVTLPPAEAATIGACLAGKIAQKFAEVKGA